MSFSLAFQPIIDVTAKDVISYEVLLRGANNESAGSIYSKVQPDELIEFNKLVRRKSLKMAAELGVSCDLNLNFTPRSLTHDDGYILDTLNTAEQVGFDCSRLVIEITETEIIKEHEDFVRLINSYRAQGIKVAIDDFGAGYSGLNLLVNFQPDQVKLDMHLVRNIESHGPRQAIVRAVSQVCFDLGIDLIAEGVESLGEYHWLREQDIELFQGYLLARPGFECLPDVIYPE